MAYNFLDIVNTVCKRLNEEELTTSNFATATGFYSQIKDAVNASIRDINLYHEYWPYNHSQIEVTLVAGTTRYAIPDEAKFIDYKSFRVKRDTSLNVGEAKRLDHITYSEYLDNYIDQEDETDTTKGAVPERVFRGQNAEFGIVPMPDKAYKIRYEYFKWTEDLLANDEVPRVPERFKYVIVDGAMYYTYMFRDNIESAQLAFKKFKDGMDYMRKVLVNENIYIRAV